MGHTLLHRIHIWTQTHQRTDRNSLFSRQTAEGHKLHNKPLLFNNPEPRASSQTAANRRAEGGWATGGGRHGGWDGAWTGAEIEQTEEKRSRSMEKTLIPQGDWLGFETDGKAETWHPFIFFSSGVNLYRTTVQHRTAAGFWDTFLLALFI